MKSSETDILVLPGHGGPEPLHWQSRMVAKLSTARFVEQDDWMYGSLDAAVSQLAAAVGAAQLPVVFVTHSVGGLVLAHAMPVLLSLGLQKQMRGAYIVAVPADRAVLGMRGVDPAFSFIPRDPLPFPSLLIASSNDPHASLEESADLSLSWGSRMVEAGQAGHINADSGHGPWPEGMMQFAGFLSRL